ncbi:MAG: carboxypeptidase regulatory-like domain-containing protein [Deltaproteobacteria bacterium]|nr:carboxypeptidase regulatory-like domain-containing protein [Deltaproteobacteria bacterium]
MARTKTYTVTVKPPAKIPTELRVTASPPPELEAGATASLGGYLVDEGGNGLPGKTVELYVNGTRAGSTTTDGEGGWSFNIRFDGPGTYEVYAAFPGDELYEGD